jgi:hypothetical protein
MTTLLLAFLIMLFLVAAMAIGVIFGRQPIAGTCGGLNRMGEDGACEICGGDPVRCDSQGESAPRAAARLGVDAFRS